MIPKRLHGLVRLYSTGIIAGSGRDVVGILVVGEEQVYLVAIPLEAEFQYVVGGRGHGPVIVAQNTFVVVFHRLTTDLGKQSGLVVLHGQPTLGQAQISAGLPPNPGELGRELYLKPIGTLVSEIDPVLAHDELSPRAVATAI